MSKESRADSVCRCKTEKSRAHHERECRCGGGKRTHPTVTLWLSVSSWETRSWDVRESFGKIPTVSPRPAVKVEKSDRRELALATERHTGVGVAFITGSETTRTPAWARTQTNPDCVRLYRLARCTGVGQQLDTASSVLSVFSSLGPLQNRCHGVVMATVWRKAVALDRRLDGLSNRHVVVNYYWNW